MLKKVPQPWARRCFKVLSMPNSTNHLIIPLQIQLMAIPVVFPISGEEVVFFLQGGSITDMNRERDQNDLNLYLGYSYVRLIAAKFKFDLPQAELTFINFGNSGDKTQDIFNRAAEAISPELWIWIGIHPLPQGPELIARHWLQEASLKWLLK